MEKEGNLKYNANAFEDAKTRYAEALKYTDKKEAIQLLIQKCTDKLAIKKQPTEPARSDSIVPKAEPAKPVIGLQSQPVVTPPANLPLNTPANQVPD
ncbi:hypothetical protein GO730_32450 [Spirosoma sp. HMF3257]|uniref:Tetratricopeptide repeat protein n=1 Tax=Spirosoma telluris TaxID=2183553 RepID=A0A327NQF9_9BACT|nr:hypothetical protein [Spirosoma telluris]RAI77661.1 hypothetical protein HMF3257_32350 [Spirosoma telluris]